jgi:hypothetical protein
MDARMKLTYQFPNRLLDMALAVIVALRQQWGELL